MATVAAQPGVVAVVAGPGYVAPMGSPGFGNFFWPGGKRLLLDNAVGVVIPWPVKFFLINIIMNTYIN